MNENQAPNLLYMVLLLVLVGSSLISMRLPIGRAMKMFAAWVGIFALGFVVFSFRSEFMVVGQRLKAEAVGTPIQVGEELRIPMAEDGHFWVDTKINGHQSSLMIDSGASITTISRKTADAAGVKTGMRAALVQTANGTVRMSRARAASFSVGPIQRDDFAVQVNDHDDSNVLGMNFLSSLAGWRVEGNYLVMQP